MKYIAIGIIIIVIGAIAIFFSPRTIQVLTRQFGASKEYYLYVPGNKSSCTWTYLENGNPSSFSTYPDMQTGEHQFIYSSDVSDMKVECLDSNGTKYVGAFENQRN